MSLTEFLADTILWQPWFTAFVFLLGACMGSFLNVCVYRIPMELSVVKPRSYCPACRTPIPWYLNIPILSYALLAGRCRFCRAPIRPRYVLIEALVAVLFLLVWLQFCPTRLSVLLHLAPIDSFAIVPVYWLVLFGLVLGTFVDFEHMIIPDRVTLGGIVAGLALSALVPELHHKSQAWAGLTTSAIGAAAGWGSLWLVAVIGRALFKKDAMGFGDVKLMGAIGAFFGWEAVLFVIAVSSLLGSIAGLSLMALGRKQLQSRIPYGPYIALAALIWMFWGTNLCNAYFSLISPYPRF